LLWIAVDCCGLLYSTVQKPQYNPQKPQSCPVLYRGGPCCGITQVLLMQPEEKKAFLVYGEEVIKPDSVWIVSEKPALDSNDKVKEVMGYQMAVDGKTLTPKGDIKGKKI